MVRGDIMLALLINNFKKLLTALIMACLIIASFTTATQADEQQFIRYTIEDVQQVAQLGQRKCEVIIRAGEYQGKAGKRIYVNSQTLNIPDDIPIRNDHDGKGFYISEWDINVKEANSTEGMVREGNEKDAKNTRNSAQYSYACGRIRYRHCGSGT